MRRFSWVACLSGLAATLIVALLALGGVLDSAELRSIDWRYQHARSAAEPLSDEIVLVGLDDASFGLVGRWPWPRAVFASAIDELVRAGASTVALDLLLSEPDPSEGGDAALAAALEPVRAVLGVNVGSQVAFDPAWKTPEGSEQLQRLLEVLSHEIDIDPTMAAKQAQLTAPREELFLDAPLEFKTIAAWRTIHQLSGAGSIPPLDDVVLALTQGRTQREGADFDAIRRIDEMWERSRSWKELDGELAAHAGQPPSDDEHAHEPPVPVLAAVADGIGVATSDLFDVDGAKRRTTLAWRVPRGMCHQFGIAAAMAHRGWSANSPETSDGAVVLGEVELPLDDGRLTLDWPTSTFDGFPAMAGFSREHRAAIAIGALVSLSRERAKLQRIGAERDRTRSALLATVPLFADARFAAMSGDEFAAAVEDSTFDDALGETERELAQRHLVAYQAAADGGKAIADASAKLRRIVEGKLVFVGWTATGALADQVQTPLDPNTPGVFVHAVLADMVLTGRTRHAAPAWVLAVSIAVLGAIASFLAAGSPTLVSTVGSGAILLGWGWFATRYAFLDLRVVVPLVGPVLAPLSAWATSTAAVAVVASRDRARVTRQFSARVSPQLVAQLARDPNALTVTGDERRITVMFGDLAGFTTIAEKLGGPGVVRTLNLYLGRLADELVQRNAYVNKFLGDGFMAFWSAFAPEPRQEALAAESAVACQRLMKELAKSAEAGGPAISVRLGIATGMAVVGDCGAPPKLNDYTAIGDVVNLASRLESANKQFGTGIIMDAATRDGMLKSGGGEGIRLRPLGLVVVVGQSIGVEIFEVVGSDADSAWIEATERAVAHFRAGNTAASAEAWREFERTFGESKLSGAYLAAIEAGDVADGILRLRAK